MENKEFVLPEIIILEEYSGNWHEYIEVVYLAFKADFIDSKPFFRGTKICLKRHPLFQDKAYTFYHMTHKGDIENEREPDLRRCERIKWAKPVIENCDYWKLKVWPQVRNGKNRICIWLELKNEPDYIIILDKRMNGDIFLWTAFTLNYNHEKLIKSKIAE
ncbi:MAG: hypothetical protein HY738_15610 [Bacteroidia bacterium]|nr:hypothetical protein [Bacteroidia bacterium]